MTKSWKLGRRALLQSLGVSPFLLPALQMGRAYAAEAPRRLIVLVKANGTMGVTGTIRGRFWPEGGGGNDLASYTLPAITAPLAPYKQKLIFTHGLVDQATRDVKEGRSPNGSDHHKNFSQLLTGKPAVTTAGDAAGPSIDHLVAQKSGKANLTLAVRSSETRPGMILSSWRATRQPNTPNNDPVKVFDSFLAGVSPGTTNAAEQARIERVRRERAELLSYARGDVMRFARNMGSEHKAQVEAHLESLGETEKLLTTPPPVAPTVPLPSRPVGLDYANSEHLSQLIDAQLDNIVGAFATDRARTATLTVSTATGTNLAFRFLGSDYEGTARVTNAGSAAGQPTQYHDMTHGTGIGTPLDLRRKQGIETFFMQKLAGLLRRLSERPDVDGRTMLDNTIVVWVDNMAEGWGGHTQSPMPWIVAGNAGNTLRTGRYHTVPGAPVNALWLEVARALGLTDLTSFGDYQGNLSMLRA